jgi:hypothetical protein
MGRIARQCGIGDGVTSLGDVGAIRLRGLSGNVALGMVGQ